MWVRRLAVGLLTTAVAACGGSSSRENGVGGTGGLASGAIGGIGGSSAAGTGGGVEGNAACAHAAELVCTRFEACSPLYFGLLWDSQDACQDQRSGECREEMGAEGSGLNDAQVASCAPAFSQDCEPFVGGLLGSYDGHVYTPRECVAAAGKLPESAPCSYDSQCARGTCTYDGNCHRCTTGRGEGEKCATADSSGSNVILYLCDRGLVCDVSCTPARYEGEPCDDWVECEGSLGCLDGVCAAPPRASLGEDCNVGCDESAGQNCIPVEGGQICAQLEVHQPGEACDDQIAYCRAGATCVGGTCTPVAAPCTTTKDCGPNELCRFRACAPPAPVSSCP